jgi:NADPH2:quinone reductase
MLEEMKCEYILNSSEEGFFDRLGELAKKLKATVCFEAIAGPFTGQLLSKLPYGTKCIVFGCLSE